MILRGNNLGERHRYLNSKVLEAVTEQKNFEELKTQPETCDVDKLFKIDLASKYKDINYILDVLKCGDVFYVTRALKCVWLYTDDYVQYVNTDYLEDNIFPYMSMKMKRKMLTAISMHVRNAERAIQFYKYCVEARLGDYAYKFLVFTSDSFKLDIIKTKKLGKSSDSKFREQLIGTSFEVAQAYLAHYNSANNVVYELRYLYSVSQEKYLDILEQYFHIDPRYASHISLNLGTRISKNILIKHRHRVIKVPLIYINILNKKMLIKYLTTEDVESLAKNLLPDDLKDFWFMDFCKTYKFILAKIPANKMFSYIKQIYLSKYKRAEFEMRIEFYNLHYYEMLNIDEREAWALQHIERDKEIPGIENYMWYKFVSYRKAVSAIKRFIFLTPNEDERSRILNILPEIARTQEDVSEILCYYYDRHVNELEQHKISFLNKIIELHNVYSFEAECWESFDKLLYSLDVYTTETHDTIYYKFMSLIYHILHDIKLPDELKEFVERISDFLHYKPKFEKITEEQKVKVATYLISFCAEKIKSLMENPDYEHEKDDDSFDYGTIKYQIRDEVIKIWNIIRTFNRPPEDCPEFVLKFMEANYLDLGEYHEHYDTTPKFIKHSEEDFVRWLKQDTQTAVDGIDEIRCNTYRWNFRLSRLFRKLKVYFSNDVGKEYLDYFLEYLSDVPKGRREYRNIKMAVVGVFYLADTEAITSLLEKHAPSSPKIDHKNINNRLFQVQKAICRLAYHPRPPLPLDSLQKYIVGNYVKFCIPVIYNYFSNLQANAKFIESLLNTPLSLQKHGLRLAFRSFDAETLKPIILGAWRKTRNVSLRMLLYETLFNRILSDTKDVQRELYEVLKLYTSDLNNDDHENVYSLLISTKLPNDFKGDFIETAWLTVNKLSEKTIDMKRRIRIINHMECYIYWVGRDFLRVQIINDHVHYMLHEQNINIDCSDPNFKELYKAKWNLTVKYIVSFNNEVELEKSLELMQTIMVECMQSWNLTKKKRIYTLRKFMKKFIKNIMQKDPKSRDSCAKMVCVYQCILDNLRLYLKKEQMYLMNWELNLSIIVRNLIDKGCNKEDGRYYRMSCKEIADAYGEQVCKILISLVHDNDFYRCFYQSVADIVNNIGSTACYILGVDTSGFEYYVCHCLINIKMTETHILALHILPRNPTNYWESTHKNILLNVQRFGCPEVRSYLYEIYVMSDCYVRLNASVTRKKCHVKRKKFARKMKLLKIS